MIIEKLSEAPANRPVCGLPDGTYDVWLDGEAQPSWYQAPQPVDASRIISAAEFRDRFTPAELAAISALAYAGTGDVGAQLLLLKVATNRDGIDLGSADVIAGLDYLVGKNKITGARKLEILV
jgi:hypothetical protein